MSHLPTTARLVALAAAALLSGHAHAVVGKGSIPSLAGVQSATPAAATYIDVNVAGWTAVDDFGASGNSSLLLNLAPGSTITGFSYSNLSFTTDPSGDSWQSELVLSVNNDDASAWLDWAPSSTNAAGTYGPSSGSWGGATGQEGPYGGGGSFTTASGTLFLTTYLTYFEPPVGITVNSGTLRIYYDDPTLVPEPGTYGLMGLGLLAVVGAARRRAS